VPGIAALAGRIGTLSIARVGLTLSREAREKVETDLTAQAIDRFRARADVVSRQFGFNSYSIREVSVSSNDSGPPMVPLMRAQLAKAGGDEPLPVEAGKAVVTATVAGSVTMAAGPGSGGR
jgi:predicted secreted protein